MKRYIQSKKHLFVLSLFIIFISCTTTQNVISSSPAELSTKSATNKLLQDLPQPKTRILTAVYNFSDQSGQFKSTSTGPSNSKSVSQGTTSMLIKALMDSDWFVVIEREGINNLINERQVIELSGNSSSTSPLLYADIIIEGGVIAYETNLLTGGIGARYLGIGTNIQYRLDEVTVYLRAVSTRNGRILKSIQTTKSIFSYMQSTGVYKYIDTEDILELEAGFSANEPPQACVLEAIEKGVHSLIIEGIIDGLWTSEDENVLESEHVKNYLTEKETASTVHSEYQDLAADRIIAAQVNSGIQTYTGDYSDSRSEFYINAGIKYQFIPNLSANLNAGFGRLSADKLFETDIVNLNLGLEYLILPHTKLSPYLGLGFSILNFWITDNEGNKLIRNDVLWGWKMGAYAAIGIQYNINNNFAVNSSLFYNYTFTDQIDGLISGNIPDSFWNIGVGAIYYF